MAIKQVQMQCGLSVFEFMHQYGTEAQCEQTVIAARFVVFRRGLRRVLSCE